MLQPGRLNLFLKYLVETIDFDSVHVLSDPEVATYLIEHTKVPVDYEFHSSNMTIVQGEISKLPLQQISAFHVPSEEMHTAVSQLLPRRIARRLRVTENLVNILAFGKEGEHTAFVNYPSEMTPLVWVGRLEAPKGMVYAPRVLAHLPSQYELFMIVSLENDPDRFVRFFAECDALGVTDRAHVLMDLQQSEMGKLYRGAARRNGALLSTSLMESFGYAVSEAIECGLRAVCFDLPVWSRLDNEKLFCAVDPGDVTAMASMVLDSSHGWDS